MTNYYITSEDDTGDLAAMHEGTGSVGLTTIDDSSSFTTFGVGTGYFDPDSFVSYVAFLEFDTTSISVDDDTTLSFILGYVSILDSPSVSDDFVFKIASFDWGGGTPTWLTPADLSPLSPIVTISASAMTSGSIDNFDLGTGVVNLGGITRFVLYTDFQDVDDTTTPKTSGATSRSQYLVFDTPTLVVGSGDPGPPSYSDEVLADGPTIYWRLDESSGTTANDSSGNGNDGTYINDPTLDTTGLLEGSGDTAVTLDRPSNQYIVQNSTLDAITYPEFSIEVIINTASDPLYFPSVAGVNGTNFDLMMLSLNDNLSGGFVNWSANSSTSGWQVTSAASSILPDVRYHLVGTWDGSVASIYINGTQVNTTTSSEVIEFGQVENFYAGSDQFGSAYDGVLDEVAFYPLALSADRVSAHYAALLAGGEDGGGGGGGGPTGPNITSMSVHTGPAAGGTVVEITGVNFLGATIVKFGTTNAASFSIDSDSAISATSPAHISGLVDVSITSPDGVSGPSTADHFTFITAPVVTNVSPSSDTVSGGTTVSITGSQFTGVTAVLFGTTPATSFTFLTDTSITAVVPAHVSSTVNIRVTTASGTSPTGVGNQFVFGAGSGGGGGGSGGGGVLVFDPVVRWVFLDTSDASTATFEINPESGGTPGLSRKTTNNRLADNEQVLVYANSSPTPTWEISGTILTESMYDLLLEWFSKRNPIEVTDDLGRTFTIMFTKFAAKREYKSTVPWFHSYEATALVLV